MAVEDLQGELQGATRNDRPSVKALSMAAFSEFLEAE